MMYIFKTENSQNPHGFDCWNNVDTSSKLLFHNTPVKEKEILDFVGETFREMMWNYHQSTLSYFFILWSCVTHLAKSWATVLLGHVTKAAECVPEVYISDAMGNGLNPKVLSSWNIKTLRSAVWWIANVVEEEYEMEETMGYWHFQNPSTNKCNNCGVFAVCIDDKNMHSPQ